MNKVSFYDYRPATLSFRDAVIAGLSRRQKSISPKFVYDQRGSTLLNSACNDASGMTAEFNLDLLHRIRRELGVDCSLDSFEHHAFYNADAGRIEMHLLSSSVASNRYRLRRQRCRPQSGCRRCIVSFPKITG